MAKQTKQLEPETTETTESTEPVDRRSMLLEGQEVGDSESPAAAEEVVESPATPETTATDGPAEPETSATEPAAELESDFLAKVKQLGYDGDDPQEAASLLLSSYQETIRRETELQRRIEEQEELANYGREWLKTQREKEQPPAEQTEAKGTEPWWSPPKFDSKWIEQYRDVTLGEDGQPVMGWKKNTPREVQEAAEGYQRYLEQWATDLVQRPQEVLPRIIEQEFDRLFEERIQARDEAARLSSFAERVRQTNRDWMYSQDSQGREVLTEQGQVMTKLLGEVAHSGVSDPELQWQYAVAMYDYLNRANQATATEQTTKVQETAAQKRRQQLQRGTGQPTTNRTGSVQRPEEESTRSQNPNLTPGQQLLQQLRQDGADFV